jgi:hypothetical protein
VTIFLWPVLACLLSGCRYSRSDDDVFFDAGPLAPALHIDSSTDELEEYYQLPFEDVRAGYLASWRPDASPGELRVGFFPPDQGWSTGSGASCGFGGIWWAAEGGVFDVDVEDTWCDWPTTMPGPPAHWEIYRSLGCTLEGRDLHIFHTPEPSPADEVTAICEQYQGNELVEVGGFEDLSFDILIRDYF